MEFAEQEAIKDAYRNLAAAAGVNFDEKNVEKHLKALVKMLTEQAFKDADSNIYGFRTKVGTVNAEIERAKEDIGDLQDRIISLQSDEIVNNLKGETSQAVREYERRCAEITRQYSQQLNPFHQATEDFLAQMEAHKFPPELQVEPLCRFLETMSYAYWKASDKNGSDDNWEPAQSTWGRSKKAGRR